MDTLRVKQFSVSKTLDSGQVFRYFYQDPYWYVQHKNEFFRIRQDKSQLFFEGSDKSFINSFFQTGFDIKKIDKKIAKDDCIASAIEQGKGLRILQQDPLECMVSFLCSMASNIPKIKMNVNKLSEQFGVRSTKFGKEFFSFPTMRSLNDYQKIWNAKTGFRAKYLYAINRSVNEDYFEQLKKMSYEDAKFELRELPGIGPKVADCILLFSLGFHEAFPIDTWIRRVMVKNYFNGKKTNDQKILDFARDYFGEYAGYAQQYLYEFARRGSR